MSFELEFTVRCNNDGKHCCISLPARDRVAKEKESSLSTSASLWHPDCVYDLKKGNLKEAWQSFIPQVLEMKSNGSELLERCCRCSMVNLCMGCPGHAHLENGAMDAPVDYSCRVAHARTEVFRKTVKN